MGPVVSREKKGDCFDFFFERECTTNNRSAELFFVKVCFLCVCMNEFSLSLSLSLL